MDWKCLIKAANEGLFPEQENVMSISLEEKIRAKQALQTVFSFENRVYNPKILLEYLKGKFPDSDYTSVLSYATLCFALAQFYLSQAKDNEVVQKYLEETRHNFKLWRENYGMSPDDPINTLQDIMETGQLVDDDYYMDTT